MMFRKYQWTIAAAIGLVSATSGVFAGAGVAGAQQSAAIAVEGYDLVSFFKPGKPPVVGNARFAVVHNNKRYLFASQANASRFQASPATFLPQYAGYCAWAAAGGYIAPGDPKFATVVKGKLYLNYDADVKSTWSKDTSGFIAKADRNWPSLSSKAR